MRRAAVLLTVGLSLASNGCWFGKKKTLPPPPPPALQPATPAAPEVKPQPQPPEQEQPPALPAAPAPVLSPALPQTLPPTPPPRPAKKKTAPAPGPPQIPQPAAGQAPQQPSPQLGAILSAGQRRQYEIQYAQSLSRARSALQRASGKSLSQTQRETVERIRTFIQQAEESKVKDLATAFELVRRADLLGQDLLKDLQ